jgi:DNA-directed RNA polymerase subunit RPC12/RpoP
MLDWARTAYTYRDGDYDGGPLVKAAERSLLNMYYRGNPETEDVVTTTVESHLLDKEFDPKTEPDVDSVPDADDVDSDAPKATSPDDIDDDMFLLCEDCGYYSEAEEEDAEVIASMECPSCGDTLITKERR